MANPNNRFLTEKDRKKAENDTANVYKQQIDDIMRGNMVAEWQPSQAQNNIKYNAPAEPKKYISAEGQRVINEYKQQEEDWRSETLKTNDEDTRKKSNNPYIRMGKHNLDTFEDDKATREKAYDEKYPIIRQTRALIDNPIVNNTIKPLAEGLLNTAGETVGELATIGNEEGKANLRNYLNEREEAQEGLGKVAYKTGEIGSNIALMSAIAPKIPGLNKLGSLTKNKYLNSALREGAENVILEGGLDLAKGDTEDFAKNRAMDFAGGALFGVGMEGLGTAAKNLTKNIGSAKNIPRAEAGHWGVNNYITDSVDTPIKKTNIPSVVADEEATKVLTSNLSSGSNKARNDLDKLLDINTEKVSQNLNMEPKNTFNDGGKIEMAQPKEYNSYPTQKVSKMRSNTFENAPILQDEQSKRILEDISGIYETKPNAQTFERATKEISDNFDGAVNRIKADGIKTAEDSAVAGLITKQYVEEMKKSGDGTALKEWLQLTRSEATNLGQAVQAISTWKKMTPEGMLLNAQRVIDFSNDKLKETNPKEYAKRIKDNALTELTDDEMKFIIDKMTKVNEIDINGKADDVLKTLDIPDKVTSKWNKLTDKEKLQRAKDIELARVLQVVANKAEPTTKDKILAMQRINLLGNTKTQSRNILGNVIMSGLETVKDTVATPIDKLISAKTGVRTTSYSNPMDKVKGMQKGFREAIEDFKLGVDTSNMGGRYSDKETLGLPNTLAFRKIENPKTFKDKLNNVLSSSEKLTGTALGMGDRPFFEGAFNDSIQQQLRANKVTEPTEDMIKRALEVAENQTFQNVSTIANGFKKLQKGMNEIVGNGEVGLGTIAMPYVKTPANIMDKAIDYSPIGGIKAYYNWRTGLKKGTLDQKKVVDQIGRSLTGSAMIALGYKMASDGVLHGSGAEDGDAKALETQSGKMPYSIKTGNTYNTIDWAQPAAIPLMIGADIAQKGGSEKDMMKVISDAIKTGGATLVNQSLLSGMANLFGGYGYDAGQNLMGGVESTAYNMLSQAVPFGSALNQVNSLADKNTRNTYDGNKGKQEVNKITSKLPGLSNDLPKKYDTVGNEVMKNNGSSGAKYLFDTLINPGKTQKFNPTTAEKMALDIYESTGETIQMPRVADKKISYKETKEGPRQSLELDAKDRSELQRLMGQKTEDAFTEFQKTSTYKSMSDSEKAKELQDIMSNIKKEAEQELLEGKGLNYYKEK